MAGRPSFDEARAAATRLAAHTSLGVGGTPDLLFRPTSVEQVAEVVAACRARGVPWRVLGGGCNLLVEDGRLEGAVIATDGLRGLVEHEDRVEVAAGHRFPDLVRRSVELSIPALPGCPGIPGQVGGVVVMNAGGRFGWVGEAVVEVQGVDAQGEPFQRAVGPNDFGYRSSPFAGCVVTRAVFRRDRALDREAQRVLLAQARAWKQSTQPLAAQSAGCMFKNPDGPTGTRSAGRLIDEAGLKGHTVGGAQVSTVHANFLLNTGTATAADVLGLVEVVREVVRARHGVTLEMEVCRWQAVAPAPAPAAGQAGRAP
jgi:UDP-N-acetylmuramate dehydrogenase